MGRNAVEVMLLRQEALCATASHSPSNTISVLMSWQHARYASLPSYSYADQHMSFIYTLNGSDYIWLRGDIHVFYFAIVICKENVSHGRNLPTYFAVKVQSYSYELLHRTLMNDGAGTGPSRDGCKLYPHHKCCFFFSSLLCKTRK